MKKFFLLTIILLSATTSWADTLNCQGNVPFTIVEDSPSSGMASISWNHKIVAEQVSFHQDSQQVGDNCLGSLVTTKTYESAEFFLTISNSIPFGQFGTRCAGSGGDDHGAYKNSDGSISCEIVPKPAQNLSVQETPPGYECAPKKVPNCCNGYWCS